MCCWVQWSPGQSRREARRKLSHFKRRLQSRDNGNIELLGVGGGALATSYRCVLLRPTYIHSASRGSILLKASAGVTVSLLAGDGLSTTLLLAQVTSALALVISTSNVILQNSTTLQYRPSSTHRLPSTQPCNTPPHCALS